MRGLILVAGLLIISSPCYARNHKQEIDDESTAHGFVRPYNSVLVARLDPLTPDLSIDPKVGEFRAMIFRRSRRLCYQFNLTGSGSITSVVIGQGLPEVGHTPLYHLSALDDGKSGNCVKLPPDLARFMIRYPLATYIEVATTTAPLGASRGQVLRVTQNVKGKKIMEPFSRAITDEQIALAGQ